MRVRLAITLGDPAGIGPEVTLRTIASAALRRTVTPVLFGDLGVYRAAARALGSKLDFAAVAAGAAIPRGAVAVRETSALAARDRRPAHPTTAGGQAAYDAIVAAIDAVQAGEVDGMVTAPISKENLVAAGHSFPGHTELLAQRSGGAHVRMMMAGPQLRVVLVTTHVALRRVPSLLTPARIEETIEVTQAALQRDFGVRRPRLAVCGLNPHAGEGGLFGNEEEKSIRPAVEATRRRGVRAEGPLPADSVFAHAAAGVYDAVICMYHDQGLAPFKLLHFKDGVNVTLGLPFVRTSPDHGTAYDIAGRNRADPSSMVAAIRLAAELAGRRRTHRAQRRMKFATRGCRPRCLSGTSQHCR